VAALLGSFLWTGCASAPIEPAQSGLETTVDPHSAGPDTQPQYSPDLYSPFQSGWTVRNIE
jgi:hypothetical protein